MSSSPHRGWVVSAAGLLLVLGLQLKLLALSGLSTVLFAWLVTASIQTRQRLARLAVSREAPDSAFEDDRIPVCLLISNRGSSPEHLLLVTDGFGPGVADRQRLLEPGPLPGRRARRIRYQASCSRGFGVFTLGPLSLEVSDPLGLAHRRRVIGQIEPFVVFPRVHPVAGLERLGSRRSFSLEERSSARPGASLAYLGAREYRPGDDLRRIHWPLTARLGEPVVREHETDLTPQFTLFLDLSREHRAGTGRRSTREYVLRTAVCLVHAAARRGDLVQVLGEGSRPLSVPSGRGDAHVAVAWEAIVRAQQDGGQELLEVVQARLAEVPKASVAALLFATIRIEESALRLAFAALRARETTPVAVFVDSESFAPMSRLALHPEQAAARRESLLALLRAEGVAGTVIGADDDLALALGRGDLWTGFA